jgi:hypothetical protein
MSSVKKGFFSPVLRCRPARSGNANLTQAKKWLSLKPGLAQSGESGSSRQKRLWHP